VATSAERYCGGEQKWWSQPVSRPPCTPNQQAIANYSKLYPGGPIPHNLARALMPRQPYSVAVLSTGGRLHPRFLRFLSPTRGTEGVVKTIERGLGRKWSSPCRRDGEVEKSLYQQGRTGWFACKAILTIMWCNQNEYNEQRGTTKDWLFPFVRLEAIVSGVSVIITKVATKRKMEKAPRKSISILSKAQK
jgi:hypothetical protein